MYGWYSTHQQTPPPGNDLSCVLAFALRLITRAGWSLKKRREGRRSRIPLPRMIRAHNISVWCGVWCLLITSSQSSVQLGAPHGEARAKAAAVATTTSIRPSLPCASCHCFSSHRSPKINAGDASFVFCLWGYKLDLTLTTAIGLFLRLPNWSWDT